jgi:deoxyribodipyrimidine photolyase
MMLDQKSRNLDIPRGKVIHWFRRDLRLEDNSGLGAALESGAPVIPLFVLDDRILEQPTMDAPRLRYLRTALLDLDRALGDRGSGLLVLKPADVPRELNRVAEETGAWSVYFNRDYTPYARARDTRTTRGLQLTGVLTQLFNDRLLVEPHLMMDEEGRVASDFDAFYRRWLSLVDVAPDPPPTSGGQFVTAGDLVPSMQGWQEPWADQVADRAAHDPDLSLHFGTTSVRDVVRRLSRDEHERRVTELARREYRIDHRFASPDRIHYASVDTDLREE